MPRTLVVSTALALLAAALPAAAQRGPQARSLAVCFEYEGEEGTPSYRQTGRFWKLQSDDIFASTYLEDRLAEEGVHAVECDDSPGHDSRMWSEGEYVALHYVVVSDRRGSCCGFVTPNGFLRHSESLEPACTGFGRTREAALRDAEECIDDRVKRTVWAYLDAGWKLREEPWPIQEQGYEVVYKGRFLWFRP